MRSRFGTQGLGRERAQLTFLRGVENASSFDTNPIYALLHEAEYCQGEASRWAAERVRGAYPEFNWAPGKPFLFTGDMVYPWMFEEYVHLRPLREAAEILAAPLRRGGAPRRRRALRRSHLL